MTSETAKMNSYLFYIHDENFFIFIIDMDRKVSKLKSTLTNLKLNKHHTRKTTKNSSARTPKHLESMFDQRSVHLSKFKTMHAKLDK
jgi:hypothetical protein